MNVQENPLGPVMGIYLCRAADEDIKRMKVASGGAVTALLLYMLEKDLVDGIVTAKRTKGLEGQAVVARTREELLRTAGNKWSIVPFAARIKEKIEEEDLKRVGIVCLPCQAQFFSQMRDFPLLETDFGERIKYIVSLFCMGTFAFEAFLNYLRVRYDVPPSAIEDIRLERDSLIVKHEEGELRLPIKEVYSYLQAGCLVCTDYTGVWSDISAGSLNEEEGWTVMITRNPKAENLLRGAREEGYLEVRDGSHVMGSVMKGAKDKLARAQRNMMTLL